MRKEDSFDKNTNFNLTRKESKRFQEKICHKLLRAYTLRNAVKWFALKVQKKWYFDFGTHFKMWYRQFRTWLHYRNARNPQVDVRATGIFLEGTPGFGIIHTALMCTLEYG